MPILLSLLLMALAPAESLASVLGNDVNYCQSFSKGQWCEASASQYTEFDCGCPKNPLDGWVAQVDNCWHRLTGVRCSSAPEPTSNNCQVFSKGEFCNPLESRIIEFSCGCTKNPMEGWVDQGQNCYHRRTDSICNRADSLTPYIPTACSFTNAPFLCGASKYNLLVADIDGSNISIIKSSSYQDMTHPRVSADKNWVAYTTYNDINALGCASLDIGYLNTEIRAVKINGDIDKGIISPVAGQLNSNSYWIGGTNEFTFLSGPASALRILRAGVDQAMNLSLSPSSIPVANNIFPVDPQSNLATNRVVFPGVYFQSGAWYKSLFLINLSDGQGMVGLTLGRDHSGKPLPCAVEDCSNIMENDPKISPDGSKVAFMRRAPVSGVDGFGWHVFVVPVARPFQEVDISYPYLGADILKNEGLPEWIDNNTLILSSIEITSATQYAKNIYIMKADGSQRTKINLPTGFYYADVFPFIDRNGKQRLILSAEKIGASCRR